MINANDKPSAGTVDYHIHLHHSPCTDKRMTAEAIIARAREVGLLEIGVVEHLHPHTGLEIFAAARAELDGARDAFPGRVLQGVEAELLDWQGTTTIRDRGALDAVADYLMLAMGHTQLNWVEKPRTADPDRFIAGEARSLLAAITAQRVDLVAHPFIYGSLYRTHQGLAFALRPHRLDAVLRRDLAQCLVDKDISLEYHCRDLVIRPQNLGGEDFVSSWLELMTSFLEQGVRFVPGSDAHYLDQIGRAAKAPYWACNYLPR
jgi:histidinol phosphatase-like PHP family hydrolase